jgi:hypothetical protein
MMRKRPHALVGPSILCASLVIISAIMLWFAHSARAKALTERDRMTQEARAASERYRHTAEDESLIRRTIDRFDTLHQRGIIGAEQRLDWADRMRAIRDRHHFAQLDFELSPQHIAGPISTPADYQLGVSRMLIRAGLLHEGDFFDLITELQQPGNALVAPRRCTLTPTPSSDTGAQNINLRAECTVEWLTANATTGAKP